MVAHTHLRTLKPCTFAKRFKNPSLFPEIFYNQIINALLNAFYLPPAKLQLDWQKNSEQCAMQNGHFFLVLEREAEKHLREKK